MKNVKIFVLLILCLVVCMSCEKPIERYKSPYEKDKSDNSLKLPTHWLQQSSTNTDDGFKIYKSETNIGTKKTRLYLVVVNPTKFEFKPVLSTSAKTVTQFYQSEQNVLAAINAGYFGAGTSYSLVVQNGVNLVDNIRSLSRTYNNVSTPYFPTRAAFGLNSQNKPSVSWVYTINTTKGPIYSYPNPSPNVEGQAPQAQPTATFPTGGSVWDIHNAIGGSPMLVKDKKINISDTQELISIDNTSSRARTAIGYFSNGYIGLFVAEGGNTAETIPGLNLSEVANLMLEMGCEGAINLDGGGSTMMVVGGDKKIRPSDAAGERAVISALLIKKK